MSAGLIQCDPMPVVVAIFMVAQGFGRTEMPFTFRSGFYIRRDQRPAGIGLETGTAARCEFLQARDDRSDTAAACIGQRAAPEGSETRTEYDSSIDQVGVLNNAFAQAGDTLVDEDENESVDEIGRPIGL